MVAEFLGLSDTPPFDPWVVGIVWLVAALFVAFETVRLQLREMNEKRNKKKS